MSKKPSNATVPLRNQFRGIDGWGPKKFKNSASGFLTLHTHICTQKPSWRRLNCTEGETGDGIRERTLSLRFLGIILRVLRLEVSTLVFCFLQTATHEQT